MNELPQANVVAFKDPEMSGTDSPNFDYQDFFENGAVALHLVSEDGIILHANTAELDLLGYPAEDYVGRHIADFYPDRPVIEPSTFRPRPPLPSSVAPWSGGHQ
ncbi:MAG: PAS domain-containing protein [Mesorhizobium sp.]|nr:MAG: PAS domain-containing protein [Mesorhizobium sp.]RWB11930.1 MAG: PAS domain-containing protein [Mesorhizobium sp.]RWO62795.1 MAG: PAS domain-containing protein [Mesorhizobium sp.]